MRRSLWLAALGLAACRDSEAARSAAAATPAAPSTLLAAAPSGRTPAPSPLLDENAIADSVRSNAVPSGHVTLETISVYGAREQTPNVPQARVVLRFDGVAVYRRSELAQEGALPRRLVLDLDGVSIGPNVPSALKVAAGGVARVRTFALDDDHVRVSYDIADTTAHRLFFLNDPYRVVIDFHTEPKDTPPGFAAQRGLRIVLDPGHGGDQPGAKSSNGLRESNVVLAIAHKVRRALQRQLGNVQVVMTREDNRFVSLEERAAIANAVEADLFLSIHLDASPSVDDPGGVSAYVLDTTDDQAALRLAARENDTDAAGVTQLQFILASLYRKDQVQRSLALAEEVHRGALRGGRRLLPTLNDRGVQRALFYVLVGAQMPAVLLEASFISRPEEAHVLTTDAYRQSLADGIAEGIVRYVEHERQRGQK